MISWSNTTRAKKLNLQERLHTQSLDCEFENVYISKEQQVFTSTLYN